MPSGSGAMLTCKVPVKRPMPCTVIVIHGVNDDGQFFPVVDQHICAGLNRRLGRDDLFPHKWGSWEKSSEANVPGLERSTVICGEGRSPVIPFHWGYRPVDHATYLQDQQRYQAQLKANNRNPDLPYSTYFLEKHKATGQNSDNLGNWLNKAYAKDGGPYPNATTNLVDMWGPGPNGGIYGLGQAGQRDAAARMYENPHRIYYVHAARRLADLIIRIRRDKNAGPDTINIVAHSQGTEISMLANFMVVEAEQRPVDCLIMCDSPYGLYPTEAELGMPGEHQSRESRRTTLANLTTLMRVQTRPVSKESVVASGVASRKAWERPDSARSNFGSVYNYFCPQDSVVALPNIQGIGWQGVDDETLKALGPNFYQRVFSEGHVVGTGPEVFVMGGKRETPLAGYPGFKPTGEKRPVNGPELPVPYVFHILKNGPETGDKLGEHLAGTALAEEGLGNILRVVDRKTGAETFPSSIYARGVPASATQAQAQLQAAGYAHPVVAAWYVGTPVESTQYLIQRNETQEEALARLGSRPAEWSQHSAITLSVDTIENCMAYDLAIGLTVAFDDENLWWELIHRADWRSEKNPDEDAAAYFAKGILPRRIKDQMNKPNLPKGIENKFASAGAYKAVKARTPIGQIDNLHDWITTPGGGSGQWPLPKPDVKG